MNFFLDENFPKRADRFFESIGHQVIDIRGIGVEGDLGQQASLGDRSGSDHGKTYRP
jgi:hypothetical protein